eukprot:6228442-Amphidinium_carterae.1
MKVFDNSCQASCRSEIVLCKASFQEDNALRNRSDLDIILSFSSTSHSNNSNTMSQNKGFRRISFAALNYRAALHR